MASVEAGELIVVGLGPAGVRLFSIHQGEGAPRVVPTPLSRAGPPPLWVFDALQRVFWIDAAERADHVSKKFWQYGPETVEEDSGGKDRLRRFSRGREEEERVVVEYAVDAKSAGAYMVKIYNPWCGYTGHLAVLRSGATGGFGGEAE